MISYTSHIHLLYAYIHIGVCNVFAPICIDIGIIMSITIIDFNAKDPYHDYYCYYLLLLFYIYIYTYVYVHICIHIYIYIQIIYIQIIYTDYIGRGSCLISIGTFSAGWKAWAPNGAAVPLQISRAWLSSRTSRAQPGSEWGERGITYVNQPWLGIGILTHWIFLSTIIGH